MRLNAGLNISGAVAWGAGLKPAHRKGGLKLGSNSDAYC